MAKKAAKGTATKTEAITLRVNPKIKFGLELLARQQHRTLSSVLEWVINTTFQDEEAGLWRNRNKGLTLATSVFLLDEIWDPEEADRLVKLAVFKPSLLSYEEELLWKIIRECPSVWKDWSYSYKWIESMLEQSQYQNSDCFDEPVEKMKLLEERLLFPVLRYQWAECQKFLNGEISAEELRLFFYQEKIECLSSWGKGNDEITLTEEEVPF